MTRYQLPLFAADQGGAGGEPDWLPLPDAVRRARAQLERRGVLAALREPPAGLRMVPAGEPPWPWLLAAAAWVIVWPAVIAVQFGGDVFPWLSPWLVLLLALLHMLLLVGPVYVAVRDASRSALQRRFGQISTLAQMLALEPDEFEAWVGMLFTLEGYDVQNTQQVADHGIDLAVRGNGLRYGLVQCKRYRGAVGEPAVRDLYGTLVHEGAEHAWLVTTGAISRQAREWAAGKPIELWDGQQLAALAKKHR
ncbi:MAG: Restriction endonuclease [Chloroflexi bacterium ADurb.Bin325]|nr:MAG: Restriction endonuclease [Chloroflexi bacterium ADurb.Bin325]